MGFYDRDYYRTASRPRVGRISMMSVTMGLLVINFAVAMIDSILWHTLGVAQRVEVRPGLIIEYPPLMWWGHFSPALAIFRFQIWRFITFQFLHADLWHLVVNMLMLYFFGPLVESYLGRWRFLAFYLLCGIAGPFGYMVLWGITGAGAATLIPTSLIPLVGASAGLFGVLIASARIAPHTTVLLFGIIPMPLRTLAWLMLAFAVYTVFTAGHNAGGEAAHLGGAVLGWLLIRNPRWLSIFPRE